jgi:hypothetical protein
MEQENDAKAEKEAKEFLKKYGITEEKSEVVVTPPANATPPTEKKPAVNINMSGSGQQNNFLAPPPQRPSVSFKDIPLAPPFNSDTSTTAVVKRQIEAQNAEVNKELAAAQQAAAKARSQRHKLEVAATTEMAREIGKAQAAKRMADVKPVAQQLKDKKVMEQVAEESDAGMKQKVYLCNKLKLYKDQFEGNSKLKGIFMDNYDPNRLGLQQLQTHLACVEMRLNSGADPEIFLSIIGWLSNGVQMFATMAGLPAHTFAARVEQAKKEHLFDEEAKQLAVKYSDFMMQGPEARIALKCAQLFISDVFSPKAPVVQTRASRDL